MKRIASVFLIITPLILLNSQVTFDDAISRTIDISALSNGHYILKTASSTGKVWTKAFIKID